MLLQGCYVSQIDLPIVVYIAVFKIDNLDTSGYCCKRDILVDYVIYLVWVVTERNRRRTKSGAFRNFESQIKKHTILGKILSSRAIFPNNCVGTIVVVCAKEIGEQSGIFDVCKFELCGIIGDSKLGRDDARIVFHGNRNVHRVTRVADCLRHYKFRSIRRYCIRVSRTAARAYAVNIVVPKCRNFGLCLKHRAAGGAVRSGSFARLRAGCRNRCIRYHGMITLTGNGDAAVRHGHGNKFQIIVNNIACLIRQADGIGACLFRDCESQRCNDPIIGSLSFHSVPDNIDGVIRQFAGLCHDQTRKGLAGCNCGQGQFFIILDRYLCAEHAGIAGNPNRHINCCACLCGNVIRRNHRHCFLCIYRHTQKQRQNAKECYHSFHFFLLANVPTSYVVTSGQSRRSPRSRYLIRRNFHLPCCLHISTHFASGRIDLIIMNINAE